VVLAMASREQLGVLYSRHATNLLRLAYVMTGDPHMAEDVVQEAFVRVAPRLPLLRDPSKAGGYLYRTVINLTRSERRRRTREQRRASLETRNSLPTMSLESRDEIQKAIMSLPHKQRAAIYLRYYVGLTESQMADMLDCSSSAVKSLLFRAKNQLRSQLKEVDR
jgi:RNA polymerase sigma factor (sigma-70 family)